MQGEETPFLVLGGGIAGLGTAAALQRDAIVLEKESRPGGLVRTEHRHGYWFDRALHVLHVSDPTIEEWIRQLAGAHLAPLQPEAWVETLAGTTRYPVQMHLAPLAEDVVSRCLHDLAELRHQRFAEPPANYHEWLRRMFGRTLCEIFFLPYNRKTWRRRSMVWPRRVSSGTSPPRIFEMVLRGALNPEASYRAYNSQAYYPQPPAEARCRGMEVFSRALAARCRDVRCRCRVVRLDVGRREVTFEHGGQTSRLRFGCKCIATLPLPTVIRRCAHAPQTLRRAVRHLRYNRVYSLAFRIRGPRPRERGHWRYYADESLLFTRLIHMHEFDPFSAPPDGWGLMAEVVLPAQRPVDTRELLAIARRDLERVAAIPPDCRIIGQHVLPTEPAYVVFTPESRAIADEAMGFLRRHDIEPLGRYGRWEYSSMAQVLRDGLELAESLRSGSTTARSVSARRPVRVPEARQMR